MKAPGKMIIQEIGKAVIKWLPRVLSLGLLLFTLPFYFGYGNPLPFINPGYSWWENLALSVMPLIFIALALGWKYPKISGFFIVSAMLLVLILGFLGDANLDLSLAVPLIPGSLYLLSGYCRKV